VLQEVLEDDCLSLRLGGSLLVELVEVLRVLKDFVQELTMACFLTGFLSRAHRLLEPVQGSCFLFALSEALGASVEFTVNQLSLVDNVSQGLGAVLVKSNLIAHIVGQDLRS
jgi:hypothetical protein